MRTSRHATYILTLPRRRGRAAFSAVNDEIVPLGTSDARTDASHIAPQPALMVRVHVAERQSRATNRVAV